jgi:hypothetical protein
MTQIRVIAPRAIPSQARTSGGGGESSRKMELALLIAGVFNCNSQIHCEGCSVDG